MDEGEKRIKQEDCSEDELGAGILTLTNKRLAFDKRSGRIADFSMRLGDTVIDVHLRNLLKFGKKVDLSKKFVLKLKPMMEKKLTNLVFLVRAVG